VELEQLVWLALVVGLALDGLVIYRWSKHVFKEPEYTGPTADVVDFEAARERRRLDQSNKADQA